jgi:hypothetical protein
LNPFQQQCLVLGLVCFAASLFFFGVMRSARNTWFSRVIAVNLVTLTLIFAALAVIELGGERAEIAAALISELPFEAVVACLCVAQAGYLPLRTGAPPLAVVAARPKLRSLLASAGLALPVAWLLAAAFGFVWPSPAVQAFAPAPLVFLVFKWILVVPAMFFAALAAVLFLSAARSEGPDMRLRVKNAAFAFATFCLAAVALESALFAGARVWLGTGTRHAVISALLVAETFLAIACVTAFLLGVVLRYSPGIAEPLVRRMATRWLPEQDRFDSHRWHAVVGGITRGVVIASYRIGAAADRLGLSQSEAERAVGTVQHIAAMRNSMRDAARVTPERARDLHLLQSEVVQDAELASKLDKIGAPGTASRFGAVHAASLHVELEAALDLIEPAATTRRGHDERPLWFYVAAVAASDVGFVEDRRVREAFGSNTRYGEAFEAYTEAVASLGNGARTSQRQGGGLKRERTIVEDETYRAR